MPDPTLQQERPATGFSARPPQTGFSKQGLSNAPQSAAMTGLPVKQWLASNGLKAADFPGVDPAFLDDPHVMMYEGDLSAYGDYTGLALSPNFRSVKGNRQDIADTLGIPSGERGAILDRARIESEAKKVGIDPRQFLINRAMHEWHHVNNDVFPGIIESAAYDFGDGRGSPWRMTPADVAQARAAKDGRDLWEMNPNPTAISAAFAGPER